MDTFDPNAGVLDFLLEYVPTVVRRLKMNGTEAALLEAYLREAYRNEYVFQSALRPESANVKHVFLNSTPSSTQLVDLLLDKMLDSCELEGLEYLHDAFEYIRSGGRVVFVSNHIGPIDATVLFRKIRELGVAAGISLTWIAGQRVWESIYLRIFARYVDLLTIHAQKYLDQAHAENSALFDAMNKHNVAALRYMMRYPSAYFVFPEGTGCPDFRELSPGVPSVMKIFRALGGKVCENVRAYPYFIKGTQDLVPQHADEALKTIDPFFRFFPSLSNGSVSFRFGPGIEGSEFGTTEEEGIYRVMCGIADCAETEEERGPYAHHLRNK